ncbi:MAG TPA: cytochrome b/b6 domain-containing protein [Thermoanaerobaculia bacterium]|nr:cytochrome b/b6 domain-containing protein [Thermoanaerobaculia bacterium]
MAHPSESPGEIYYRRFTRTERIMHATLFSSFLGLALTGLPLLFSDQPWAQGFARAVGVRTAGNVHRFFAVVLIGTFAWHLFLIVERLFGKKDFGILWGPDSLVPQPRDVKEFMGHMKWFLHLGPRPKFDHFAYWQKFDYWAVFWGMGIIGGSGMMLWFPTFFARLLPGWVFNIATVIHGEEALLAVIFIFTIHFFNENLRPEKFPMDDVMFTGRVSADELRDERPGEWERLRAEGALAALEVPPPSPRLRRAGRLIGTTALTLGLVLVSLTIYSLTR